MIPPHEVTRTLMDLGPYFTVAGECQVIDYSRRTYYGPWIKVRIEHPEQLAGFEQGQRYQLLMVRIGDDDMPTSNEQKPYKTSQLAGMMCADPQFRSFITATYGEPCHNKDQAAEWVRQACNVASRSLLDTDETAARTFRNILAAFDDWKQEGV